MPLTEAQHDTLAARIQAWKAACPLAIWRRGRRDRTQTFVAAVVNVSTQTVRMWEGGTRPSAIHLGTLGALTDIPMADLWDAWEADRPRVEDAQ